MDMRAQPPAISGARHLNPTDTFCSHCGTAYARTDGYPRACAACQAVAYANPKPVMVCIVPVGDGVLAVRRGIPPHVGKLALPAGFHVLGEDWQAGAAREVFEETGLAFSPRDIAVCKPQPGWNPLFSTPGGNLLVFCMAPRIDLGDIRLQGDELLAHSEGETQELVVVGPDAELAFPAHGEALRRYFLTLT